MTLADQIITSMDTSPREWECQVEGNYENSTSGLSVAITRTGHYRYDTKLFKPQLRTFTFVERIRLRRAAKRWLKTSLPDKETQ